MPRTLLARTFLLLAILVLLTTAAWLSLFRYMDAEPRARETAQLAASAVNLIRASLFAAAPEKRLGLFAEFSSREGIRLLPAEPEDQIEAMPDARFALLQRELHQRLGDHTRIAASVDGVPGFWVSFRLDEADEEEYWLVLPRERAARSFARHWLTWGLLAVVLALAVAWLIASRISKPLKAMAQSAETVGRGQIPTPLPEDGGDELSRLARAFNAMAADLQRNERERSEVLAGISHDLRTPLTRLRLEAEMSLGDETTRQAVVSDIEQMESVISQFMDYARRIGRNARPDRSFRASGQHRQPAGEHRPAAGQRHRANRRPAAAPEGDCARRHQPARQCRQIWRGRDQLRLLAAPGEIHIEVGDRGPGIPESEIDRLKRPFTRLEAARTNATGTGLGLAIVDRIARLHDGQLDLLPNPGAACWFA
jgi:two-component system osmolarity sensor histidine kinase EnvZ